MREWVVGIDLGATKIALGLIDPANRIAASRRIPTQVAEGPEAAADRMAQAIMELGAELPHNGQIAAVGICSPGPLDHQSGTLLDPPNLTGWRNVPLRQMLADRLRLPVTLEHDAKAAALGEFYYGAGQGEENMVYIVLGTGVGAAIIANGQLYRGMHNASGEMGHITIDRHGEPCHCGSRGCVELYTSGPSLARHYQRFREEKGLPSETQPVTGRFVAERAEAGDEIARQVLTQAGEVLGTVVASLAMVLDIELYVIGSSVAKAGDLLFEPARRTMPNYAFRSIASHVRIVPAALSDDGPILGCGWLARQTV